MRRALVSTAVVLSALPAGCGGEPPPPDRSEQRLNARLIAAAFANDLATARALVKASADVNAKDRTQQSRT